MYEKTLQGLSLFLSVEIILCLWNLSILTIIISSNATMLGTQLHHFVCRTQEITLV